MSYSTADANHLLNVWDSSIWGSDATASFQTGVAERTGIAVELNKARRALQNYVAIPKYLTQPLWDALRSQDASDVKLEKLISHVSNLGLRCPSEGTVAMLLALSFALVQELTDKQKLQLGEAQDKEDDQDVPWQVPRASARQEDQEAWEIHVIGSEDLPLVMFLDQSKASTQPCQLNDPHNSGPSHCGTNCEFSQCNGCTMPHILSGFPCFPDTDYHPVLTNHLNSAASGLL